MFPILPSPFMSNLMRPLSILFQSGLMLFLTVLGLPGNELHIMQTTSVRPLVTEVGVAPNLFSSDKLEMRKFLNGLQKNKFVKLIIHLYPNQKLIDKSTPINVEIENNVILNGEKIFIKSGRIDKKYIINITATLTGKPFISDISDSKVGENLKVTIFVPLYGIVTQSVLAKNNSYIATKNIEILDRIVVAIPD
jgi:hypothetical protein